MSSLSEEQQIDRLTRLLDVSRQLSATLELDSLLQLIIEVASELTFSESCLILLYDPQTKSLEFIASPGVRSKEIKTIRVPIEGSIAGAVFKKGSPLIVQNAHSDPRLFRGVDQFIQHTTKSILAVPMMIQDRTIGVIELVNKKDGNNFSKEDQTTLSILASHAAVAIQNTNLLVTLKKANEELKALDRLKSDFIAIASHELRTPLGIVLGHATYLEDILEDREGREQAEIIIQHGERLKNIIEDLGNIDTFQSGKSRLRKSSIDICKLIQEVVQEYQEMAETKNISISIDNPQGELKTTGDKEKLHIAFGNILKNALIYTNDRGKIHIKTNRVGNFIETSIIDNGIGIPESDLEKIFERFYQVESHLTRRYGGMGLGLSIAKDMVMFHEGKIWVESVLGKGSRFTVL
ncbi:MAG: GAF domain-containing protein, partial [Anaerolineales bacterium]|nr:GAF domain-containing protein [Anaerolineales bacterium]